MFRGKKRRQAIWDRVAGELAGRHHRQSRWWRSDEYISAVVEGVAVKLDVYVVSTGKSAHVYTRVAAAYAHGPGPKMKVYKHRLLSSIGKAFGMRDVTLGDPGFDQTFVVRTAHAAIARRLWTRPAMERMRATLADAWIESSEASIALIGNGRWQDPEVMHAGFRLIGELAARDIHGEHALRAIEGATVARPHGAGPRAELDTGVRVHVQAEDHGDRLVMAARCAEQLAVEPVTLEIANGTFTNTELASSLPQSAHAIASRVGSGTLVVERAWMSFVWRDLELDPARLRAGADLLGSIAIGGAGYR